VKGTLTLEVTVRSTGGDVWVGRYGLSMPRDGDERGNYSDWMSKQNYETTWSRILGAGLRPFPMILTCLVRFTSLVQLRPCGLGRRFAKRFATQLRPRKQGPHVDVFCGAEHGQQLPQV